MSSVDAINAISDASTGATTTAENPSTLLDRDAFLKLLVAQLKYQDPTKPADSSQMLAQSAQLTMVDRLNELSASFAASTATQQLSLAGAMVGRQITFVGGDGGLVSETVTSARIDTGGLVLVTAGYEVPYDAVAEVAAPPATEVATEAAAQTGTNGAPAT